MCGLAGIWSRAAIEPQQVETVLRMAGTLRHRGPDGEGWVREGGCALAFRRLAIIDMAAPSPPYSNEDRTIWSVANAELYNEEELRRDLVARGHALRTGVDTEILPHLWEEYGSELVARLDGMFALAVWDARRETLLLARDRAGEKPLYYWEGGGELVFASELRAFLEHPAISRALDPVALQRYLLHDYIPAPLSPIAGVRKLPAGHLLLVRGGRTSVHRYWDIGEHFDNPELARRSAADLAAELDERIGAAVERRRRSDTRVGVFLSGGIDSSTILAHLAEQVGAGVPAFSVGHGDRGFDESHFARRTAQHFGAEFESLVLGQEDLAAGLRRVGEGFDEPLGDVSILPTFLLAHRARRSVKVVLSGEGADELFAGYPTYLGHRIASGFGRLPAGLQRAVISAVRRAFPVTMGNVGPAYLVERFALAAGEPLVERHHTWFGSVGPELQRSVLAPELLEILGEQDPFASARRTLAGRELPDDLARLLCTDFSMYLQDDLLTKVDRATMLASLEARAPFLDHQLIEFAAGLPSRLKQRGTTTKFLLRRAVRRRLPSEILGRRKRGFNIPFSRWLLDGLGDELRSRFAPDRVAARGLLSAPGVGRLLDEHLARRADHRKPLFNLLALDLWCDRTWGEGARVPLASASVGSRRPMEETV